MQSLASQVMLLLDKGESIDTYINQAKFALLGHDLSQAEDLFPDIFYPEDISAERVDFDRLQGRDVQYINTEGDKMTADEMQKILSQFPS